MKHLLHTLEKRELDHFVGNNFSKNLLFVLFLVGIFIYVVGNLVFTIAVKGHELKNVANTNFSKIVIIPAQRGIIYDKDMNPLVENVPDYLWIFDLNRLNRFKTYTDTESIFTPGELDFLKNQNVELNEAFLKELNDSLRLGKDYIVLKNIENNSDYMKLDLQVFNTTLKNKTQIISDSKRNYKNSAVFSNILGYTQYVDEKTLQSDSFYTPYSKVGVAGLEKKYENFLRGENGQEVRVYDSLSKIYTQKSFSEGVSGYSLVTSIDSALQQKAYDSLKKYVEKSGAVGGSVVIQNPKNGEILTLVNYPSFDNNLFSKKISYSDYSALLNSEAKPLINRAIQSAFPPGSVFKLVLATGALQEKLLDENTYMNDTGGITVNGYTFKTWKAGGHGSINIVDALRVSSDTFFYVLGGGHADYPQIEPLGISKIYKWARLFGFGSILGIDLPNEVSGTVPNEDWKIENIHERWFLGNTYHTSIGQGYLLTTPLQINAMTLAIANGGFVYKPTIVKSVVNSSDLKNVVSESRPTIISNLNLDSKTLTLLKEGMKEAVNSGGTAYPLFNYKIPVAGKTGTSEFGKKENGVSETHAWFTSFAPIDNPSIVVSVFVEDGGEGSDTAAPVVKEIYDYYFFKK